jgi:hypothetical protein
VIGSIPLLEQRLALVEIAQLRHGAQALPIVGRQAPEDDRAAEHFVDLFVHGHARYDVDHTGRTGGSLS